MQAVGKERTWLLPHLISTNQKLASATIAKKGNTTQLLMPRHAGIARQENIWTVLPRLVRAKDAQKARQLFQGLRCALFALQERILRSKVHCAPNVLQGFIRIKVQLDVRVALQVPIAQMLLARAQHVLRVVTHMHLHQSVLSAMQGTLLQRMQPLVKSVLRVLSALRKLRRVPRALMAPLQLREAQLVRH